MGIRYCPVCLTPHDVSDTQTVGPEEASLTEVLEFCPDHRKVV